MALGRGKGQLGIPVDSFPTNLRAALCSQYTLEPSMGGWSRLMLTEWLWFLAIYLVFYVVSGALAI